jgi:thiol:disulfide interchange protein DsbD
LKKLREDFVVITLYVDDKKELTKAEWVTSKYDGELKKTIGKKFADFQIYFFNVNAQPYYALIDPFVAMKDKKDVDKAILTQPKAYDLNPDNFVNFLQAGIDEFKKRHPAI